MAVQKAAILAKITELQMQPGASSLDFSGLVALVQGMDDAPAPASPAPSQPAV